MNSFPKGPQVGDKMMPRLVFLFCIPVKEHEERQEAAPGISREVMQSLESTPNPLKTSLQLLPLFPIFHQMRIYYFAITKNQMKVLIFKQPTFYKNQIGARSQLCNWWNHRQNQLIRWKARAGWLAPKIFKPTQGTETMKRSRNYSRAQALSPLRSAFGALSTLWNASGLQAYLQQQVATTYTFVSLLTQLQKLGVHPIMRSHKSMQGSQEIWHNQWQKIN